MRGVDGAATRFDQAIVEQRDRLIRRNVRLRPHRDGIECLQSGALLEAFLASQLGSKSGARRIAGDSGAETRDERCISLDRFWQLSRRASRLRRLAATILGAEADFIARRQDSDGRVAGWQIGERPR